MEPSKPEEEVATGDVAEVAAANINVEIFQRFANEIAAREAADNNKAATIADANAAGCSYH